MLAIPTTMTVAFVALSVERFLGFPSPLRRIVGHPVNWLYRLNGVFSALVPDERGRVVRRRLMGAAFCILSVLVTVALASIAISALREFSYAWFWEGLLATPFLAQYPLRMRTRSVASGLAANDLPAARHALIHLVDHDLSELDESDTTRGCLEAVAENLATSVVTPAFWLALFTAPLLANFGTHFRMLTKPHRRAIS